jgi:hypothetical protein
VSCHDELQAAAVVAFGTEEPIMEGWGSSIEWEGIKRCALYICVFFCFGTCRVM